MAKINFNTKKLTKEINGIVKSAPYERIGRAVVKDIKDKTRAGISPITGSPFTPLSESWIKRKSRLAPFQSKLSKFYSKGRSNLTFSGQLLNALTSLVTRKPDEVTINIFTKNTKRTPYRGIRKPRLQPLSITNREVEEQVSETRPYIGLSDDAENQVNRILRLHIKNSIARLFK